ncbi:MAG: FGGY-family carbohydrate kinase [Polyangiaceae bacterium]
MSDRLYLGVDVGTASARAAVFDANGVCLGKGARAIEVFHPEEDFAEHSSDDVWRGVVAAVAEAKREAGVDGADVRGVGFDATCSLVVLGADDAPVSVSPTGEDAQNVIVWMDHRAIEQAARINALGHPVLRYVGGVISPEMQTPKLLWLKERMPKAYARAAKFFDLPDWLVYRATGADVRSLCTTVCKWTYLGHEDRWDPTYFERIGLDDVGPSRIGALVRPMGERAGGLSARAAAELGLAAGTPVGVAIIDAHAGGLGMLGARVDGVAPDLAGLERRLALIGGTSTCHMAVSREPIFLDGIWGPYKSAMVPGMWLTEGGQSATGALVDHVLATHGRFAEVKEEAKKRGIHPTTVLNEILERLAASSGVRFAAELTRELHVFPDFHGNRSPRADPTLRGMVSGLKLTDSVDALALLYLATIQGIAHGTKHVIDTMNAGGYAIDLVLACGGDMKNPVFLREHTDITGCRFAQPLEPEAVLLGASTLGAVASGDFASVLDAMAAMNRVGNLVAPAGGEVAAYHARKHAVFQRMHGDQLAYRALMDAR